MCFFIFIVRGASALFSDCLSKLRGRKSRQVPPRTPLRSPDFFQWDERGLACFEGHCPPTGSLRPGRGEKFLCGCNQVRPASANTLGVNGNKESTSRNQVKERIHSPDQDWSERFKARSRDSLRCQFQDFGCARKLVDFIASLGANLRGQQQLPAGNRPYTGLDNPQSSLIRYGEGSDFIDFVSP